MFIELIGVSVLIFALVAGLCVFAWIFVVLPKEIEALDERLHYKSVAVQSLETRLIELENSFFEMKNKQDTWRLKE